VPSDGKVSEKEINRQIGSKVALLLEKSGYEVILTCPQDVTTSLGERTSYANHKRADVFFSLHANSGAVSIAGVETFYFDPALLKNEWEDIPAHTKTLIGKTVARWHTLSKELAHEVQAAVVQSTHAPDRHTKKGVIQVLLGFQGPAALIEVGYLTNQRERALLCSESYQKKVAEGIYKGIKMFVDKHFA
jgi:N-acetylmuramoyl-L-alanine amidase